MKKSNLVNKAGRNLFMSACALASVLFITSCQKDAATNPDSNPSSALNASKVNNLSLASTTTGTFLSVPLKVTAPLNLINAHDITISGDSINGGKIACISLYNCYNIHITKCKLVNGSGLNGVGINMNACTNVVVDSCYIGNVASGVYAYQSQNIKVKNNQMRNMVGPLWRGQFVQFNSVTGGGNRISNNLCENIVGQSHCEDGISLYNSSGTSTDPIYVLSNSIRGGGPSTTGSGVTLGDHGGNYIVAAYNIIVTPGYVGMHVAGGTNILMSTNTIYSDAVPYSHLGLGYGNYSPSIPSNNITINLNKVHWMVGLPSDVAKGMKEFDSYYQGPMPTGWSTNVSNAVVTASVLPTKLITWN
jgi:hypothetical protein